VNSSKVGDKRILADPPTCSPKARQKEDSGGTGAGKHQSGGTGAAKHLSGGSGAAKHQTGGTGAAKHQSGGTGAAKHLSGGSGAAKHQKVGSGAAKHQKGGTWKGVKEHQSKLGASAKKHSGAGSGAGAANVHLKSTAPSTSSPSSHCSSWEEPGLGSGLHLCWPSGWHEWRCFCLSWRKAMATPSSPSAWWRRRSCLKLWSC